MTEAVNHHVMTVAVSTDEYIEWECPECEYRWRYFYIGEREIITPSWTGFTHNGTAEGLAITGITPMPDDGLDIWRDALSG